MYQYKQNGNDNKLKYAVYFAVVLGIVAIAVALLKNCDCKKSGYASVNSSSSSTMQGPYPSPALTPVPSGPVGCTGIGCRFTTNYSDGKKACRAACQCDNPKGGSSCACFQIPGRFGNDDFHCLAID